MAKKRVNGEGTIGKRKDGRWEARYIAGRDPETGKQIRKSILGKTQAEVRTKLKEALAEATEIDVVKSGEYNVAGWVQAWCSLYAQPNVRETTALLQGLYRSPCPPASGRYSVKQADVAGHSAVL